MSKSLRMCNRINFSHRVCVRVCVCVCACVRVCVRVCQVANGLVQTTGWPSVVTCISNWFGKGR